MAAIAYLTINILVLHFIYISSTVGININKEQFIKFAWDDLRVNSNVEATSAVSLFECCVKCIATGDCALLSYNSLLIQDNCELITSGQSDVSFLTSQSGWNVFFGHAGQYRSLFVRKPIKGCKILNNWPYFSSKSVFKKVALNITSVYIESNLRL